jgi:hypothetical protein
MLGGGIVGGGGIFIASDFCSDVEVVTNDGIVA